MSKENKPQSSFSKLLRYSKRYVPMMIIALIGSVIGTFLTLFGPEKLSDMTDIMTEGLFGEIDLEAITSIGITLIIIYGLSFVLSLSQGLIMANVTQKVSKNLRTALANKINKLPMSYYNNTTTGDILSRVTNDVDTIGQTLNQSIGSLVSAGCLFLGSLIMMLKTNVMLTLTAILATVIGFLLMILIVKKSQKYFLTQQECLGKINGHIEKDEEAASFS